MMSPDSENQEFTLRVGMKSVGETKKARDSAKSCANNVLYLAWEW